MTKVSAKSTFAIAIHERMYQLTLGAFALLTLAGILKTIDSWPIQDIGSVLFGGPVLTAIGILAIYFQLRRMNSVTFEATDKGLQFEENSRKHFFTWKEIKAIRIEPSRKRITVWLQGEARYMRYLGITEGEFAPLKQFLQVKISEHEIEQRQ